ncbi:MAG: hypothetical protein EHM60_05925 [Lysobacterales bacterium]|nr:MAG: hypothetical protein EHM60_05925 [Xanthomonadales bacterium]
MVSSQRRCSSTRPRPSDPRVRLAGTLLAALLVLSSGCSRAGDDAATGDAAASDPAASAATNESAADELQCRPVAGGLLQARLQGAIDAELGWGPDTIHCLGGVRPQRDGIRLIFKGNAPGSGPLLIVLGAAPVRPGESARNVPVNVTVVREGAGEFYATQGEDKCAFDELKQTPVPGAPHRYRLEGRGYCTQPARAVGGDGAVLVSRFDVIATVDDPPASEPSGVTTAGQAP